MHRVLVALEENINIVAVKSDIKIFIKAISPDLKIKSGHFYCKNFLLEEGG